MIDLSHVPTTYLLRALRERCKAVHVVMLLKDASPEADVRTFTEADETMGFALLGMASVALDDLRHDVRKACMGPRE